MKQTHTPVLIEEVLHLLSPKRGEAYFDATAGYGGHAAAIAELIGPHGQLILADRDSTAIRALTERFGESAQFIRANYVEAAARLIEEGEEVDMILMDLGVSSPQFDIASRGFSFKQAGPLDMRMDQSQSLTASEVVNDYPEERLANLLAAYGEERQAKRVAHAIVRARPLATTLELAAVVRKVVGSKQDIDSATRTFQAIRIEVNAELESLEEALPLLVQLLKPSGRLAVISFHSLEDRIVKQFIERESRDCICPPKQPICTCQHQATLKKLTSKPVLGTQDTFNPRARSAKLRAAEKINKNQKGAQK
jgi:16S rRNA (cytosine1402-N4)-methyltransferase